MNAKIRELNQPGVRFLGFIPFNIKQTGGPPLK